MSLTITLTQDGNLAIKLPTGSLCSLPHGQEAATLVRLLNAQAAIAEQISAKQVTHVATGAKAYAWNSIDNRPVKPLLRSIAPRDMSLESLL